MRVKTIVLLIIGVLFLLTETHATHYMGGEITWECLPNGCYRFKMRLYRECYTDMGMSAATFGATEIIQASGGGFPTITMTRVSLIDISPQCNSNSSFPHITCPGMGSPMSNMGAVQENYYTSDASYPTGVALTGIPPATGWTFSYASCCRNPSTNVVGSSTLGWYLKATMYPYNGQNAYPCFDWSPAFSEPPLTVLCSGYPFRYSQVVKDNEKDSLTFEWGQPLLNATTAITSYAPGYAFNDPLPGVSHNPNNIPGTVNPHDGTIYFTSFTNGAYITSIKVTAWKCGVKVAEIWRDIQIVLLACNVNNPPNVPAPFINPNSGLFASYVDTVYAGDLVSFPISGTDFEFLPNMQPQTVKITAFGPQFGTSFSSSTMGCLQPPCATLNPPPPLSAPFAIQTTFTWQTSCAHITANAGCGTTTNKYTFIVKVTDDYCPVPAVRYQPITLYVFDKAGLTSPRISCTRVMPSGDVAIYWQPVPDSANIFDSYKLYSSSSPNGPFTLVSSIPNKLTSVVVHSGANANAGPVYYFIRTASGCLGSAENVATDTVSTIHLDVSQPAGAGNIAMLTWNPPLSSFSTGLSGMYLIYREYPSGVWTLIDSTTNSFYPDTAKFCNQTLNYRVEILNTYQQNNTTVACSIASNTDGGVFSEAVPPPPATIENLSYQVAGDVFVVSWLSVSAADLQGYIVQRNTGSGFVPVDTVYGAIAAYADSTAHACSGGVSYQIYSVDSCWNINTAGAPLTVFEMNAQYSASANATYLSWPVPTALLPNVNRYTLYVMKNYGPWMEHISTSGTSFHQSFPDSNTIYCYYVKAVDSTASKTVNSCPVCVQTGTYTGIGSPGTENVVRIFPNPTKEEWRVVFGREERNIRIELFDVSGRRVLAIDKAAAGRGEEVLVSAAHLPEGVYLMHIQTEQQIHRKVVLINK